MGFPCRTTMNTLELNKSELFFLFNSAPLNSDTKVFIGQLQAGLSIDTLIRIVLNDIHLAVDLLSVDNNLLLKIKTATWKGIGGLGLAKLFAARIITNKINTLLSPLLSYQSSDSQPRPFITADFRGSNVMIHLAGIYIIDAEIMGETLIIKTNYE